MKSRYVLAAAAALVLVASAASADVRTPGVDRRQAVQQERIGRGYASGSVTGRECRLLEREQTRIRRTEHRMKADGCLSVRERARLHRMQDRAGRHIHRAKHNGRTSHRW